MGRRRKKQTDPFIRIPWGVWDSYPWGELTNAARVAYAAIIRKKDRPGQDEIILTFDEAERLMHRKTFKKATDELLEWGFIQMKQRGGLKRRTNIYSLSEEWRVRNEKRK